MSKVLFVLADKQGFLNDRGTLAPFFEAVARPDASISDGLEALGMPIKYKPVRGIPIEETRRLHDFALRMSEDKGHLHPLMFRFKDLTPAEEVKRITLTLEAITAYEMDNGGTGTVIVKHYATNPETDLALLKSPDFQQLLEPIYYRCPDEDPNA